MFYTRYDDKPIQLRKESIFIKLQTLYPTRSRRGLINVIGTGFKYPFGILDEEDREKIINYLHTVTSNNKNMINTINSQNVINFLIKISL